MLQINNHAVKKSSVHSKKTEGIVDWAGGAEATACLENGNPDRDCCALPSEASCADGYVKVMSGTKCAYSYEEYSCVKLLPDPSACVENGKFDNDCCAKPNEGACLDGYVKVMSGNTCGWFGGFSEYMCYPEGVEPSGAPDTSACLENGRDDGDCCAKPSEANCKHGYKLDFSGSYCSFDFMRYSCYHDDEAPGQPGQPTPTVEGGQACWELCLKEFVNACNGQDVSPGTAEYVKDREGCAAKYTSEMNGELTACVVKGSKCVKSKDQENKCTHYTAGGNLAAHCDESSASATKEPWASFK